MTGRVPPHDLDAEGAVLSACLLDGKALDAALEILQPEMFYSESNRRIFEAIREQSIAGQPADVVTVASWLRDRDRLGQVGGAAYLAQLTDAVPFVANVEQYANVVKVKARVRKMISTCQRIAAEGYGDVGDAQAWIDASEQSVYEIARTTEKSPMRTMGAFTTELVTEMQRAAAAGQQLTGTPTGFKRLDEMTTGLHDGETTIVAARPGAGKTALLEEMAKNIAAINGDVELGAAFFSLEMPGKQIAMRAIAGGARVDVSRIRGGWLSDRDWDAIVPAATEIHKLPIWIDETPAITLLDLRARVRRLQAEFDRPATSERKARRIGVVLVDYLQLMRAVGRCNSREQEVAEVSRGLKQLAKELKLPVVAAAQLNRGVESPLVKNKRPTLASLRESGAVEQDADNVIFIYRDEMYEKDSPDKGLAELIVAKQRNGPTGTVKVRFDRQYTSFANLAANEDATPEASYDYHDAGNG